MFGSATRKALLISLVGGAILLYLVDPILRFMPSLVLRIVGAISQRWTDSLFRAAAQPESVESLSILTIFMLAVVFLFLSTERVLAKPNQPNPTAAPAKTRLSLAPFFSTWFLILASLLFLFLLRDASSSIERCFRYRLTVLSPHLSDRESKELAASFTLMQSRADYDAIRGRLKEYAEKYNVVPVIKSLEGNEKGQRRCI